jgi:hypothetical protein
MLLEKLTGVKDLYKCDCGAVKEINRYNVANGKVASCGCLKKKMLAKKNKERSKHGMTGTTLFIVWDSMRKRASANRKGSKKARDNYFNRGIEVCKQWDNDFLSFYNWAISNGYKSGLQIDRIDNQKGYYPENCRFVSSHVNNMNKRNNLNEKKVKEAEELLKTGVSIAEISKITGLKYSGIYQRLTGRRGLEKITAMVKK